MSVFVNEGGLFTLILKFMEEFRDFMIMAPWSGAEKQHQAGAVADQPTHSGNGLGWRSGIVGI